LSFHGFRPGNSGRPAHVRAALVAGEASSGRRFALSFEPARKPMQTPGSRFQRWARDQFWVIELASAKLGAVEGVKALLAEGKPGNLYQRLAAYAAIGGKQIGEKTFSNLNRNSTGPRFVKPGFVKPGFVKPGFVKPGFVKPGFVKPGSTACGSNRRPCHCGFGLDSPNSVSTTAEDGLRDAHEKWGASALPAYRQYSGVRATRQRCECRDLKPRPAGSRSGPTAARAPA
jgi:hypothetical protein